MKKSLLRCIIAVSFLLAGLTSLLVLPSFSQEFAGSTINVLYFASHRQISPAWAKIGEFEKRTGIKVNVVGIPNVIDIVSAMTRDVVLGTNEYDVYETGMIELAPVARFMASIDELILNDGMNPEEVKKSLTPVTVEDFTHDGALRGLPYYMGIISGAYRKDLFEDPKEKANFKQEYGYELQPPRTWEQLIDIGKFFTRDINKDGEIDLWGLILPGKADAGEHMVKSHAARNGLGYQDERGFSLWGPKHPENHELMATVVQDMVDLHRKWKVVTPIMVAMQTGEVKEFYKSGKAAMVIDMIYYMWDDFVSPEVVSKIGPSGEFRFPFSGGKTDEGLMVFTWGWAVNDKSEEKGAVWEFLKWIALDEDMIKLYVKEGVGTFVPANLEVAKWAAELGLIPIAATEEVKWGRHYDINAALNEIVHHILEPWTEEVQLGKITAEEWVTETGRRMDELMIQRGLIK